MRLESLLLSQCLRQPEPPASHAEAAVIPLLSGLAAFILGARSMSTWALQSYLGLGAAERFVSSSALLPHAALSRDLLVTLVSPIDQDPITR